MLKETHKVTIYTDNGRKLKVHRKTFNCMSKASKYISSFRHEGIFKITMNSSYNYSLASGATILWCTIDCPNINAFLVEMQQERNHIQGCITEFCEEYAKRKAELITA